MKTEILENKKEYQNNMIIRLLLLSVLIFLPILTSCLPSKEGIYADGPSPASTPSQAAGFYQSTTYGFSVRFPTNWTSKETGQREPVVEIRAPGQFPAVLISVSYIDTTGPLKDLAAAQLSGRKEGLTNFAIVKEADATIGDVPSYSIEYTWDSRGTPAKGRMVVLLRGSQLYQFDIISPTTSYDSQLNAINSVVTSFRLEEAQPFGIPRSQALTLASDGPHTLDPAQSRELLSHSFVTQVFSGLVAFDKDMNLIPDLAEKWVISPDGRTYTFSLRRNAKFHSGKAVKASDVKYSWERAATPQTGSMTAATYLGDIVGVKDMLAGKTRELGSVKAIDDYTLEVTIDAPKAYFLAKLFYPVAYIVDRANVESGGKEWWRKPNGTGPFKLRQWLPDELVILERYPDFYRTPSSLNYIVFRLFSGIPMMMYENSEIDTVTIGGGNIDRAQDAANPLSKELKIVPELSLFYVGFNHSQAPFDDPLVRKAFVQAIDKDKIVRRVQRDTVPKADSIVPPGMPGYSSNIKPIPFDPAQARASLAASKYKGATGLPPITMTVAGEGGDVSQAIGAIIDQWRVNLGV
ncbi:MAG: ABC transporter substrate-binding protein, partial [Dehalococcoidia bacterium]|nr:ABC transporter substrate-binding protein [Dehalococcoidia bacterium]